jgi:hypothetical protein
MTNPWRATLWDNELRIALVRRARSSADAIKLRQQPRDSTGR